MDYVQSWLDAKEVRRMAEDLMTPAPVDGASVMDAGFGEDFEGFGNSSCSDHVEDLSPQELPQERPARKSPLAEAQRVAKGSGMLGHAAQLDGAVVSGQKSKPRGLSFDRLSEFSLIVRENLGARAMFLLDSDGQVIIDEVKNPKLIQVARTMTNASYTAHRQSVESAVVGNFHVKIAAAITLEVVSMQCRDGILTLGVLFSAPIGSERVIDLAGWLEKAVMPEVV